MSDLMSSDPAGVDLSGFTVGSTLHWDGAEDKSKTFASIVEQLDVDVPDIFGESKRKYPYLQAINFDATTLGINEQNFLEKLFDMLSVARMKGCAGVDTFLMSMKWKNLCVKILERGSGAYRHISSKASPFNYEEITIGGPDGGQAKIVGLFEKDDDTIIGPDWSGITIHSNNGFRREMTPDGNYFYTERTEDGHEYITDIALIGELVVSAPSKCFLIKNLDQVNITDGFDKAMYYGTGDGTRNAIVQPQSATTGANVGSSIMDAIKKFTDSEGK
jgi:hypothetical protein